MLKRMENHRSAGFFQPTGFFQEQSESTNEVFRSIKLIFFNQCISIALILRRNENKVIANIALINSTKSENNKKMRLENFVYSVCENLHTTIHAINCFTEKNGLKS